MWTVSVNYWLRYLCKNIFQKSLRWGVKTWFSTIYPNDHNPITITIHWLLAIAILFWTYYHYQIYMIVDKNSWLTLELHLLLLITKKASKCFSRVPCWYQSEIPSCIIRFRKLNSCRVPYVYLTCNKCSICIIFISEMCNSQVFIMHLQYWL